MKHKIIALALVVACMATMFAGCKVKISPTNETKAPAESTATVTDKAPDDTKPEPSNTERPEDTNPEETSPVETKSPVPVSNAEFSDNGEFLNLDAVQFAVNGKVYTLGQTTLQQLIDDEVPFSEDSLVTANNAVPKSSTMSFDIELGEWWCASIDVLNDTDAARPASECYISRLYFPIHEDETQDILSFSFPLDMTMEELMEKAGEPSDTYHYDGDNGYYSDDLEYCREGERYYGDTGYQFEFTQGILQYIYLDYTP